MPARLNRDLKTVPSEPVTLRSKHNLINKKLFTSSSDSPGPGAYHLETTFNVTFFPFSIKKESP